MVSQVNYNLLSVDCLWICGIIKIEMVNLLEIIDLEMFPIGRRFLSYSSRNSLSR